MYITVTRLILITLNTHSLYLDFCVSIIKVRIMYVFVADLIKTDPKIHNNNPVDL